MKEKIHINLTYESMISLIQGKELHLKTNNIHIIFKPPFDGVFFTHQQLSELRYDERAQVLRLIQELSEYKEDARHYSTDKE